MGHLGVQKIKGLGLRGLGFGAFEHSFQRLSSGVAAQATSDPEHSLT